MARVGCTPRGSAPTRPAPRGTTRGPPTTRLSIAHRPRRLNAVSKERGLTEKHDAAVGLLEEPAEAAFMDIEELRSLASEGRERGYLTFEEIAACLEEVEVTKEQITEFRTHLLDAGVEIVASDSRAPEGRLASVPADGDGAQPVAVVKKPEIDLTVEPSLDSLRLYLRSI